MGVMGVGLIVVLVLVVGLLGLHRHSTAGEAAGPSLAPAVIPADGSSQTGQPGGTPTAEPTTSGHRLLNLLSDAITNAPSTDLSAADRARIQAPEAAYDTQTGGLSPELRMADGNPLTAWKMDGNGDGSQITVTFGDDRTVSEVGLINGDADGDRYSAERRILQVEWSFGNGAAITQTLRDDHEGVQYMSVPPVSTRSVTLTVVRTTDPGSPGSDYTAISELRLSGWVG